MTEPRFGNCGDCKAWDPHRIQKDEPRRACWRHPPSRGALETTAGDGCFDFIPKETADAEV